MAVSADIKVEVLATQTGSNDFGGSLNATIRKVLSIADGTAANQADILFVDERAVAASTNDDLDLAGVLSDAFGSTITAAELVALLVVNEPITGAANVSSLTIGGGTNPITGFLGGTTPTVGPIGPGGAFMLFAPDASGIGAVTAGSADNLRIANGAGGTATYQIGILARSA